MALCQMLGQDSLADDLKANFLLCQARIEAGNCSLQHLL